MNLKVEIKVTMSSGALITLTAAQRNLVLEFVKRMLNSGTTAYSLRTLRVRNEAQQEKRKNPRGFYKRILGTRRWKPQEEALVVEMLSNLPDKLGAKSKALKQLGQALGRTPSSIYNRYWKLSKNLLTEQRKAVESIKFESESQNENSQTNNP